MDKVKLALLAMQRYSWEQGTAMQAFLEAGDMDIVVPMACEAAYRAIEDGRTAQMGDSFSVTDPCSTGEAILAAWKETGNPALKAAFDRLLDWALRGAPRNGEGIVYHRMDAPQFWADSMYMLPPFLAAAGEYDECLRQIRGYLKALLDPEKHLMRHMWNDGTGHFDRAAFWGSGSGWTVAGLARVIDMLPDSYEGEKRALAQTTAQILEGMKRCMRPDGLFHDVLDDPDTFLDANCSQMAAYAIYRGVASGWLERSWLETADVMRAAAEGKVDAYGRVRDVCGSPSFDKSGCSPEANAFYILMQTAAAPFRG